MEHTWLVLVLFLLVLDLWLRLFSCRLFVPLLLYRVPVVLHHLWAGRRGDLSQRGHRIHVVRCPVFVYVLIVRVALYPRRVSRSY
jgi:predicted transporter